MITEQKILQVIGQQGYFTVLRNYSALVDLLDSMEQRGLVEFKEEYRDALYYTKPGMHWTPMNRVRDVAPHSYGYW